MRILAIAGIIIYLIFLGAIIIARITILYISLRIKLAISLKINTLLFKYKLYRYRIPEKLRDELYTIYSSKFNSEIKAVSIKNILSRLRR